MPKPARPTLRLLRELSGAGEWSLPYERTAAAAATPQSQLPPLHDLQHPVIQHAASIYPGSGEVDAQRESISSISSHVMWKLRHGRWRAAVYEDHSGQAWLVAVGIRAEGDAKDFYTEFPDLFARRPADYLPTEDDRRRLRLEAAEEHLSRWETVVHERTRGALHIAAETGAHDFEVPGALPGDATLGKVRLEVETVEYDDEDPPQGLSLVAITVKRADWSRVDLAERADIVILAAIEPHEQAWDTTSLGDGALFSIDCSPEELGGLLDESTDRQPGKTIPGQLRHWTHKSRLTQSIIEGRPVEGLCGTWFVPRQDAANFETCPHCAAVHRRFQD